MKDTSAPFSRNSTLDAMPPSPDMARNTSVDEVFATLDAIMSKYEQEQKELDRSIKQCQSNESSVSSVFDWHVIPAFLVSFVPDAFL